MKSLRNPGRKPTHPVAVLREDVLPELRWTQTELANRLMVSRQTVSQLLHEEKAVTAEMAIRVPGAGAIISTRVCGGLSCKPRPATRFDKFWDFDFRGSRARRGAVDDAKPRRDTAQPASATQSGDPVTASSAGTSARSHRFVKAVDSFAPWGQ